MVTLAQLKAIYRECPEERLKKFLDPLNATMEHYSINTPQRIRMFLAQIGHESGQLRYVEELASGEAYEGRRDLGNTQKGDGKKYKGRGLIQITGKTNYILCGMDLNLPLLEQPELLSQTDLACMSAGWFWDENNLNALCDMGLFEQLTKRINGGLNGYADRYKLFQRAFSVVV
jgi:putative chitinase